MDRMFRAKSTKKEEEACANEHTMKQHQRENDKNGTQHTAQTLKCDYAYLIIVL